MLNKQIVEIKDFGYIKLNLGKIMAKRKISTYELSNKTGIKFTTIQKIKVGEEPTRISFDVLAKLCYVLDCKVGDILEYVG